MFFVFYESITVFLFLEMEEWLNQITMKGVKIMTFRRIDQINGLSSKIAFSP